MSLSRRNFIRTASAFGVGFSGLRRAHALQDQASQTPPSTWGALGPLLPDPDGLLELPEGFGYRTFSATGEDMDDGLIVPPRHDGMAAFERSDGKTVLVRNHENLPGKGGAFGEENELLSRVDPERVYDLGRGRAPGLGGTTTLVFDTATQSLESHWLSLAGTVFNCSGGPTPWGSWISCEENTSLAGDTLEKDHGYCFEVPANHEGLTEPVPLKALGRFNHEALAVDPNSGVVYLTEDRHDSLVYRFVPKTPGELTEGKLQALAVEGAQSLDTRNWHDLTRVPTGMSLEVSWVDLEDIDSRADDLRLRGFAKGAARFARGEGLFFGGESLFFCCTIGGSKQIGQVWRYTPSKMEGTSAEKKERGRLELFLEPNDPGLIENCDNLTVAPWGHLILCEDGNATDHLLGVTSEGGLYLLGRNARSAGEFAGATFSPDGSTLFVNMQEDGLTVAITGPWHRVREISG